MVNVTIYGIHGSYGIEHLQETIDLSVFTSQLRQNL